MNQVLTIAIPTWNNWERLNTTLGTLVAYTECPYKIIVVDNGSEPALAERAKAWPEFISYVDPGSNLGWMGGINYALERADTPYFCMLNDDVAFPPDSAGFWRKLLNQAAKSDVGLVGPSSDFIAGYQNIGLITEPFFDTSFAIGVCLVGRTEFLRELGGLDETLPGGDDLDLTIRVRKAGKKVRIVKGAFLHHVGQQSGPRKHGAYYDSAWHQEVVRNAIIRKHGLRWQFETWNMERYPIAEAAEAQGDHEWILENLPGGEGIDVGCGSNPTPGAVGVDNRAPGELGAGGQKNAAVPEGTVQGEADDLPFPDNSQDFVVASHVLEHLISPVDALEEWHRVLKTGGKLIMCLPDHETLDTMMIDHTHLHAYTVASIASLFHMLCELEMYEPLEIVKGPFGSIRVIAEAL